MSATPNPSRSLPNSPANSRLTFRVICAWCRCEIPAAAPKQTLTANSHGICEACTIEHFGVQVEEPKGSSNQ